MKPNVDPAEAPEIGVNPFPRFWDSGHLVFGDLQMARFQWSAEESNPDPMRRRIHLDPLAVARDPFEGGGQMPQVGLGYWC